MGHQVTTGPQDQFTCRSFLRVINDGRREVQEHGNGAENWKKHLNGFAAQQRVLKLDVHSAVPKGPAYSLNEREGPLPAKGTQRDAGNDKTGLFSASSGKLGEHVL